MSKVLFTIVQMRVMKGIFLGKSPFLENRNSFPKVDLWISCTPWASNEADGRSVTVII